jgi:hypothetical protein
MSKNLLITGKNPLDIAKKFEAMETLLKVGSTAELEKLAKLAKDPKKKRLLKYA